MKAAEREHASPASRPVASSVELGYWSWLRVVLVVIAVAQRRLDPSSSATTSTVDRALPSSALQSLLEPTHNHHPAALGEGLGGVLSLVAPHDHGGERRLLLPTPDTATRNMARAIPASV